MRSSVVTIGNFDGVHLGHQKILEHAKAEARRLGARCAVYTFRPHPRVVLRPELNLPLLTTYEERSHLLKASGIDTVVEQPFDLKYAQTTAKEFFTNILASDLHPVAFVVGHDFAFGKNREGSLSLLKELCAEKKINLTQLPALKADVEIISSSKIRELLLQGNVHKANSFLGYSFFYTGEVQHGEARGRRIGFPTANLIFPEGPSNKLILPYGVYITSSECDGKTYPSVTNVGVRPTFQSTQPGVVNATVETHFINETADVYGRPLKVSFLERIREEKKFPGVDALKAQIASDVLQAQNYFSENV